MKYLNFRPYRKEAEINQTDNGIYFKILSKMAPIVKNILLDNGLTETKSNKKPVLFWNNGSYKLDFY